MPTVSIVLPNYNYAQYLDERIQSLLSQTYRDFELIILDDASTDNSLEVINRYAADPRVSTQFYTENSGSPYKRWNDGAELAQGKYLLIAGADDSCHPDFLRKLVEKLESNPSVGLAYTQSWNIDGEGDKTHLWTNWTDDLSQNRWSTDFINVGEDECKYLLFKNTIPNASAVLMRQKTFAEAGKFDPGFRLAADWMLWTKMLMISDIAFVAEPLNYFRTHNNVLRTTSKPSLELEERLRVIHYVSQNVDMPDHFWETIFDPSIGWWIRMMIRGEVPWSRSQKIYQSLKGIDPNINYRLLRRFMDAVKRKFF
jgi:glycosyltransferase involved in cell wall biosynthesis